MFNSTIIQLITAGQNVASLIMSENRLSGLCMLSAFRTRITEYKKYFCRRSSSAVNIKK